MPETTLGYADLLPVRGGTVAPAEHAAGIAGLLEKNEAAFLRDPRGWAEERFVQMQTVNRLSTWAARAAEWEAFLGPAVASKRGPA